MKKRMKDLVYWKPKDKTKDKILLLYELISITPNLYRIIVHVPGPEETALLGFTVFLTEEM